MVLSRRAVDNLYIFAPSLDGTKILRAIF